MTEAATDPTTLAATLEALRASEARFRAVFERAGVGMARVALADARLLEVNEAFCEMLGYPPDALVGVPWPEVTHPDDVAKDLADFRRLAAGELEGYTVEKRYRHQAGHDVWARLTLSLVRDGDGHPECEIAVIEDVTAARQAATERERLYAEARAAAARIAALQRTTTALNAALEREGVARVVHEAVRRELGAHAGMLAVLDDEGRRLQVLPLAADDRAPSGGAPSDAPDTLPHDGTLPASRALAEDAPAYHPDRAAVLAAFPQLAAVLEARGTQAVAFLPLAIGAGPERRVFGIMAVEFPTPRAFDDEDRTLLAAVAAQAAQALERARLYADAAHARDEAERANESKSQFLANMSHELRTPLNAIAGYVELLDMGLHGPVTGAQRDALGRVQKAQRHLLGLINDVLNYARLEAGRVEFDVCATLVDDVVRDVVPLVEPQLAAKGLTLAMSLPQDRGEPPVEVWADREKLGQVLLNLLSNAVKFTPARQPDGRPGEVAIALVSRADAPGHAWLRVRDTGIGIAPERQGAIFEPFVQVSAGLTRAHEGTGLGLAISRDLARGMGGELRVRSAEGEGSSFTVQLRRVRTLAGDVTDRRARGERRDTARRRGEERRRRPD